jgi:hypothetical protein
MCKICKRQYDNAFHLHRSEECKKRKNKIQTIRKKSIMNAVRDYAMSLWCKDCWYKENRAALQFDHLHDKYMNISEMIRSA